MSIGTGLFLFLTKILFMEKKKVAEINAHGSLALLALGHVGIRKWREAVHQEKMKSSKDRENGKKAGE